MTKDSKYKYVYLITKSRCGRKINKWAAKITCDAYGIIYPWGKECNTEKQAALAVDKKLIEMGREPVNILKRK